jgi:hypothetical protein
MAELFQVTIPTVNDHLANLYDEGELARESTVRKFRIVQIEGQRQVSRQVDHYNLNAIIAVGYRIRSHRGTQFRIWATERLREYLVKGFTMDDARLKRAGGGTYFEELLARIRDIRSSERVFWRKVLDINFINRANEADQRVFELLNEKFKLFNGVFGASDEVLGALESGIDIEKRISEIYKRCRTSEQIQNAFDQLQLDLNDQITSKLQSARTKLLENFDEDVHYKLRLRQSETQHRLDRYGDWLWALTATELGGHADFDFGSHHFTLHRIPEGVDETGISIGRYLLGSHPVTPELATLRVTRFFPLASVYPALGKRKSGIAGGGIVGVLRVKAGDLHCGADGFQVLVVAQVNGGVTDAAVSAEEEQGIAAAQARAGPARRRQPTDAGLLVRIARKTNASRAKRGLHQAGTVHARRSSAAPQVRSIFQTQSGGDHPLDRRMAGWGIHFALAGWDAGRLPSWQPQLNGIKRPRNAF